MDSEHPECLGETSDFVVHFDSEGEERGLSDQDNRPLLGMYPVDVQRAGATNWQMLIAKHKRLRVVPGMGANQHEAVVRNYLSDGVPAVQEAPAGEDLSALV